MECNDHVAFTPSDCEAIAWGKSDAVVAL